MAQSGTLGVRVFTSQAQLPVEDATVIVTQKMENGKYRVLSLQETNQNGSIQPIRIATPDVGESTQPFGVEPPFTQCDVWVEHVGYEMMLIEDVQIFPGVESEQLVELNPLVSGEPWTERSDVRTIPNQNL